MSRESQRNEHSPPVEDYSESFGAFLKRKIAEASTNQRRVALDIGASTGQMSGWVNNVRRPTPENVRRLAHRLGVPEREMLIRAGYLPRQDTDLHPLRAELLHLARELPLDQVELAIGFLRWRLSEAAKPAPRQASGSVPENTDTGGDLDAAS